MSIRIVFVVEKGIFAVIAPCRMVRMDCFQSKTASIFLNHLFPRIRVSSLDSNTSKNDGTCDFPMVRGTLLIIPDDLILASLAVTITILDGLLMSNLRRFWRAEVMMLVVAPLSTTADNKAPHEPSQAKLDLGSAWLSFL